MVCVDDSASCLVLVDECKASQRDWFDRCLSGIGTGLIDSDIPFSRYQMCNSMLAITTLACAHAATAREFYAVDRGNMGMLFEKFVHLTGGYVFTSANQRFAISEFRKCIQTRRKKVATTSAKGFARPSALRAGTADSVASGLSAATIDVPASLPWQ